MSTSAESYDAIVVGAGLGGMSAAAHLAALGQRVLLLERYKVVGGCSHTFRRRGKWEFDAGVHYIGETGPEGVVRQMLRGLALDEEIEWLPLDNNALDIVRGPDFELKIPFGWDNWERNVLAAFPDERKAVKRYTTIMRKLGEKSDRNSSGESYRKFVRDLRNAGTAAPYALMPHSALLASCGLSAKASLALSVQDGAIATTPVDMASLGAATLRDHFIRGTAQYPRGGGQALGAGFMRVLTSHGGTVRTNVEVTRIVIEGGRAVGVELADGERINANAVVAAGDVVRTYRDLVGLENLPARTRARMKTWKLSRPLLNGFFGVEIDPASLPNSNVFSIPSWDDARSYPKLVKFLREVVGGHGHSKDPIGWAHEFAARQPMFVQCSTRRDPLNSSSAPVGHAAIEVQTIAPYNPRLWGVKGRDIASGEYRQSETYQEVKKIILEGMAQRMEQAYPGTADKIVFAELGTPSTQEFYTHSEKGTAFGLATSPTQVGPMREGPRTAIPGLFLAGASTPFGPGTAGAMISGLQVAGVITGRPLLDEVRAGAVLVNPDLVRTPGADYDDNIAIALD